MKGRAWETRDVIIRGIHHESTRMAVRGSARYVHACVTLCRAEYLKTTDRLRQLRMSSDEVACWRT
jgi:hypothetical protein